MSSRNLLSVQPPQPTLSLEEELLRLARTDAAQFVQLFRAVRTSRLRETARACLRYLGDHGSDPIGQKMAVWLSGGSAYLEFLLAPDFLPTEKAARAVRAMHEVSLQFAVNLRRHLMDGKLPLDSERLVRSIQLLEAVIDPAILIPWLRNLTQHPEPRIRSTAAKTLCEMRPNLLMIERQLKSDDARVRANAIEALWTLNTPQAIPLFNDCLMDEGHRVVVNALIGLHRLGVPDAFERLLSLAKNPAPMVRRAAIWGMSFLADSRAVPALRVLAQDPDEEVRAKALPVLAALAPRPEPPPVSMPEPEAVMEPSPPPEIETPIEPAYGHKKTGVLNIY